MAGVIGPVPFMCTVVFSLVLRMHLSRMLALMGIMGRGSVHVMGHVIGGQGHLVRRMIDFSLVHVLGVIVMLVCFMCFHYGLQINEILLCIL